jgi:formylglycine-generating enzyme required for sulfatase activity
VAVGGFFLTHRQKNSRLALEIKEESQAIIKTYREMEQAGAGRKNISVFLKAGPRIEDMKKLLAAEEYEKVQAALPAIAALVDEAQTELEEKRREEEKKNSAGAEEIVRQAETGQLDAAKAQAQAGAPELFKEGSTKLDAARKALTQGKIPEAIALAHASKTAFDQAAKKAEKKTPPAEPEKEVKTAQAKKEAAAAAAAAAGNCPDGMAYIPAGSFPMGSSPDDSDHDYSELPNKPVNIPAYCIDVYEYPNKEGALPRTKSTWSEAKKICQADGNRLCTEPEWEKACKGAKNNKYPYGNTWDGNICNTQDPQGKERAVRASGKQKKCKSDYGVYDLSGNVKEWTEDAFSPEISDRTVKGGSSSRPDWATRCAARENFLHPVRNPDLGFRCCRDAP